MFGGQVGLSTLSSLAREATVAGSLPATTPFPVLPATSPAHPRSATGVHPGPTAGALAAAIQFFVTAQCMLSEPWPSQAHLRKDSHFDYIIVGGGTGGSLLAARLATETQHRVLLLEAGPDPPKEAIVPKWHFKMLGSSYDWRYKSVSDPESKGLIDGSQALPSGKMLGGSGSLGDMVYARGFPADFAEWARAIGDDWSWEKVLPYFKKTEHMTDERIINDPELMKYHGRNGPIEVSGFNASTFENDVFLNALKESGFKIVKDMTNPTEIGAGRPSHTIKHGRRSSAVTALLNEAAKRDNLYVLKGALVTKILMNNKAAEGVKVLYGNQELHFYADKEVIISAGTYNTPKLLMLSGIGPQEHLNQMGIELVQDLPVGQNLHDHIMVLNYIAADNGTCYSDEGASHMNMIRYLYDQSGPNAYTSTVTAYMALNASSHPNNPDFGIYPVCMPVGTDFFENCVNILRMKPDICLTLQDQLQDRELISVAVVHLQPKSRGSVKLRSADPMADPLIYAGTFSNPEDLNDFPEAIAVVDKMAASSYFQAKNARVVNLKIEGCDVLSDEAAVRCRARATAMSAWHAAGTAPMGAVVDGRLRVRGVRRLRVVDASVMPQVIRGDTDSTVTMIAERAADFIKSDQETSQTN